MNKLLTALIATVISGSAYATVNGDNSCQGNCAGGSTPSNATATSTTGAISNNSSATGGNASSTANGGTGIGVGVGLGGAGGKATSSSNASVNNSGNSSNRNNNRNTNAQGQLQGQLQGQQQTANGGNASAQGGTGVGQQGQDQSIYVEGDRTHVEAARRAAATAYAAPLTSSNDTCMGSSSGAVQAPGIGVSVGTTWVDKNCVMLKNSREMWNMGLKAAALARMCMDDDNRRAFEQSGIACPASKQQTSGEDATAQSSTSNVYTGNDPIVRRRLGLD